MLETQSLDQSNPISQKATKKLPLQNSILDESDLMHRSGVENDQGKKIFLRLQQKKKKKKKEEEKKRKKKIKKKKKKKKKKKRKRKKKRKKK